MSKIELLKIVPSLSEDTYLLVEALWSSYKYEYCPNYSGLENKTGKDRTELKKLLEPFKKMGFVYTARGLMTEDGEVAGSGFCVNGQEAFFLLELALYRYNYNDRPFGKAEDYVPTELNVAGYQYRLVKEQPNV